MPERGGVCRGAFIPADLELLAFDLDNTLYDESLYFDGAFKAIAPVLAAKSRRDVVTVETRLQDILREKGRHYHYLFTDILAELGLDPDGELNGVLDLFRTVEPPLELFPGTRELLHDLRRRYRLGMITSGMRQVQENKIRLLRVADCFEQIVFSSTLAENKPGPMPFQRLLDAMHVAAERAAYVGDNPLSDFHGANRLGMLTVRVHNPEFDGIDVPPERDARVRVERVADLRGMLL